MTYSNITICLYTISISYITYQFPFMLKKWKSYFKELTIVKKEKMKAIKTIQNEFFKNDSHIITTLDDESMSVHDIISKITLYKHLATNKWTNGKISGTVYAPPNTELNELVLESYKLFQYSNPLHIDIFPGLQVMESSIVNMCLDLYNAPSNSIGNITSGGTESIFMACKAYRDYSRDVLNITEPEMIISKSAHVAFTKSAHYLCIKVIELEDHKITKKLDTTLLEYNLNKNTILVVASAPSFSNGVIDPIHEISTIIQTYNKNIGFHLDACLGGFLLPFMDIIYKRDSGLNFNCIGLTSISMDTHKYACSPKGTSVLMYRNKELAHYQYFVDPDWTGGIYISPTLAGSRSGELIASTWATMMYFGKKGYIRNANKILEIVDYIYKQLLIEDEIDIIAKPDVSIISFTTRTFSIYLLCSEMNKRGWSLNSLQFPSSAHICITPVHTMDIARDFIKDIKASIDYIKTNKLSKPEGVYGIYGSSQAIPDRSIIKEIGYAYLDSYYKKN